MKLYFVGDKGLCPVCGDPVEITGATADGRLIASCSDAFWPQQWETDEKLYRERQQKRPAKLRSKA